MARREVDGRDERDGRDGPRERDQGRLTARDQVALEREPDLPVVARLVVEIRSDGRRTVARGAMEDAASGRGVAVEARGDSPFKLALSLARAIFSPRSLLRR